jgi:hypothetical protein
MVYDVSEASLAYTCTDKVNPSKLKTQNVIPWFQLTHGENLSEDKLPLDNFYYFDALHVNFQYNVLM